MSALIKFVFFSIFASVMIAFYGDDIVRLIGNEAKLTRHAAPKELNAADNIANSVQVSRRQDGHYWAEAGVNHSRINFIVDTGASVVILSNNDAKALGFNLFANDYVVPVNTAGGQTRMAPVRLDRVSVGPIELYAVDALVAQDGMLSVSLLGMNFLNRLDRFEFSEQRLILEH